MISPYYDEGGITIYHGDALEILPELSPLRVTVSEHDAGSSRLEPVPDTGSLGGTPASLRVDLALIDPPYNAGIGYGPSTNDNRGPDEYEVWCADWFALCRALSARTVVFPGHGNLAQWMPRKPTAIGCWFKPGNPSSSVLGWCEWEPWLYWGPRVGGSDTIRAVANQMQRGVGDHPCPKPLKLFKSLLLKMKPDTILDPMMGSGTSLLAAKDLGRRAIGIEIEERYCEIAARRLGQEVLAL